MPGSAACLAAATLTPDSNAATGVGDRDVRFPCWPEGVQVSWLYSGPGGLLAGAFIGVVMGVFFEEPLKRAARFSRSQLRRLGGERWAQGIPDLSHEFRLGHLHTPVLIIEGDGAREIKPENVTVKAPDTDVEPLPADVARWRDEIAKHESERKKAGDRYRWNGLSYAVKAISVSRVGPDEESSVTVHLRNTDYYTFLASQKLDTKMSDGRTLREVYLTNMSLGEAPAWMRSSFGLNVALVTSDNWLIVPRRSRDVAVGRNQWNSSANESLSRDKDSVDGAPPDLFMAAQRGVKEELHIEADQYSLRLLCFNVVTTLSQWGALFLGALREMTWSEFHKHITRGIEDGWENDRFEYVKFEPEATLRFLLRGDKQWAPAAPVLYYLSLVNVYGRSKVDAAAIRVLRDLGRY